MSMPPSKSSAAAKAATKTKRSTMTDAHKEALALGRTQGRAVRVYLEALERNRPRRGRKRTADSIRKQLTQIEDKIGSADPLQRLHLMQARRDLTVGLEKESGPVDDMPALEKEFIVAAREYGDRKGILYSTWREAGVPPAVLEKAGIRRGSQA
jgi:hypothetical protein